jgi:hypothetical protein
MSEAMVLSLVSVKVMSEGEDEDELKCVEPLPVIFTFTVVPAAPAPGETTATAAGGLVVVADPVSDTTSDVPPGAEFAIVSEPVRVVGLAELGVKTT